MIEAVGVGIVLSFVVVRNQNLEVNRVVKVLPIEMFGDWNPEAVRALRT